MELLLPDKAIAALEKHVIFPYRDLHPTLGVIIKTDAKPDETSYLTSLINVGKKYNVRVEVARVKNMVEASKRILAFKTSSACHGIIILSDFGKAQQNLYDLIPPRLDIDSTSTMSLGKLIGTPDPVGYRKAPCAPVAVLKILSYENIDLTGKKVAVIGRSVRVGRPLAEILLQQNATVTIMHSKSDIVDLQNYDIVCVGIGQPNFIDFTNKKQWNCSDYDGHIYDIGINEVDKILFGDVNLDSFENTHAKITPVPGGIGKMATVVLMTKLFTNAATMAGLLDD